MRAFPAVFREKVEHEPKISLNDCNLSKGIVKWRQIKSATNFCRFRCSQYVDEVCDEGQADGLLYS